MQSVEAQDGQLISTWYGWLLDPAFPKYFPPIVALTLESKSSDAIEEEDDDDPKHAESAG
jgi:hypothetical protein